MSNDGIESALASLAAALPWCCIAPAAFALGGVATAGAGTALAQATPLFLIVSAGLLARAFYLSLVRRRGPRWVRGVVLASTSLVAALWFLRLGFWPG